MRIANPLYDHAFKYLMSNDRLAKKVISTILDKEVLELELAQQEIVINKEALTFTLYRLDFKALIRDEKGKEETVLIEIQKSKLPNNVLRFRNYLGMSYSQKNTKINTLTNKEEETAYPIVTIYILGYQVSDIPYLATKIDRKIINASTKEEVNIESDFIDLVTHTCYILQVGRLPEKRKTKIEKFMTLFNQTWIKEEKFILDLEEVPEEFKDIAEYLQNPLLDSKTIQNLAAEQEIEMMFASQESEIAILKAFVEDAQMRKEEAQAKQREAQAREKEAQAREQNEKKQKEIILKQSVQALYKSGMPIEQIAVTFGIELQQIKEILNK